VLNYIFKNDKYVLNR